MKLLILVLLILLDFLSKKVIFHFVELNKLISLVSFIDITHIQNYGISFGLFAGILPMWLIVLLGVIMIFILFLIFKTSNKLGKWGLLLIISGGISNIGDRLINNYVLDFIFLHYKQHYWPAFNFADIYISVGVLLIIIENYMIFRARIKDKND